MSNTPTGSSPHRSGENNARGENPRTEAVGGAQQNERTHDLDGAERQHTPANTGRTSADDGATRQEPIGHDRDRDGRVDEHETRVTDRDRRGDDLDRDGRLNDRDRDGRLNDRDRDGRLNDRDRDGRPDDRERHGVLEGRDHDHHRHLTELELAKSKNRWLTDIGLLLLRLLPAVMLVHGIHKAMNYSGFRASVAANSFGAMAPDLFSIMVVAGEIALPILIAIGLLTRWAALLEAIMMAFIWVTMFAVKGLVDPKTGGPSGESALTYVFLTLPLVFTGAGRFSLDHLIGAGRRRQRAERRAEKRIAKL